MQKLKAFRKSASLRFKKVEELQKTMLSEIAVKLHKYAQTYNATVEEGKVVAAAFSEYGNALKGEENITPLGEYFLQIGEVLLKVEELRSTLAQETTKCAESLNDVLGLARGGISSIEQVIQKEFDTLFLILSLQNQFLLGATKLITPELLAKKPPQLNSTQESNKKKEETLTVLLSAGLGSPKPKSGSKVDVSGTRGFTQTTAGSNDSNNNTPEISPRRSSTPVSLASNPPENESSLAGIKKPNLAGIQIPGDSLRFLDKQGPLHGRKASRSLLASKVVTPPNTEPKLMTRSPPLITSDIENTPSVYGLTKVQFLQFLYKEQKLHDAMEYIIEKYLKPIATDEKLSVRIYEEDAEAIFFNVDKIYQIQGLLLKEMERQANEWPIKKPGQYFLDQVPVLDIYVKSVSNFGNAMYSLTRAQKLSKQIKNFFQQQQTEGELTDLAILLASPLEAIPRWKQIVSSMMSAIGDDDENLDEDAKKLKLANSKTQELLSKCSRYIRQGEELSVIRTVQDKLKGFKDVLIQPGRRFIKEGTVSVEGKGDRIFLFNDMLIVGKLTYVDKKISQLSTRANSHLFDKFGDKYKSEKYKVTKKILLRKVKLAPYADATVQYGFQITEKNDSTIFNVPSLPEKNQWMATIQEAISDLNRSKVFGVPLDELMSSDREKGRTIPLVIEKTISWIIRRDLSAEGLFRICGSQAIIDRYKDGFDTGTKVEFEATEDVHSVAGVLKLWIRELPAPLLTPELYEEFLSAVRSDSDRVDLQLSKLKATVSKLPQANKYLLQHLVSFLVLVNAHSNENKMNSENLSIVFGPSVLWKPTSLDFLAQASNAFNDQKLVLCVIQLMIENYDVIFKEIEAERAAKAVQNLPSSPGTPTTPKPPVPNKSLPLPTKKLPPPPKK